MASSQIVFNGQNDPAILCRAIKAHPLKMFRNSKLTKKMYRMGQEPFQKQNSDSECANIKWGMMPNVLVDKMTCRCETKICTYLSTYLYSRFLLKKLAISRLTLFSVIVRYKGRFLFHKLAKSKNIRNTKLLQDNCNIIILIL